jgi:hypothetical protein
VIIPAVVLPARAALTPAGNPFTPDVPSFAIPVELVVVWVMFVSVVLIHKLCVDDANPTVLAGFTTIVPVAATVPQPPVSGIE